MASEPPVEPPIRAEPRPGPGGRLVLAQRVAVIVIAVVLVAFLVMALTGFPIHVKTQKPGGGHGGGGHPGHGRHGIVTSPAP